MCVSVAIARLLTVFGHKKFGGKKYVESVWKWAEDFYSESNRLHDKPRICDLALPKDSPQVRQAVQDFQAKKPISRSSGARDPQDLGPRLNHACDALRNYL